jgi:tetratricopeptide (TPR) repeat protein
LKKYDEALRLQEPLADRPDAGAPVRSNLALSYAGKAATLLKRAQWAPAVATYQKAIDIHQNLLDRDNSKATWLIYLADEQHGLAEAYLRPEGFSTSAIPDSASQLQLLKDASAVLKNELDTRNKLITIADDPNNPKDPNKTNLAEDRDKVQKQLDALKIRIESRN